MIRSWIRRTGGRIVGGMIGHWVEAVIRGRIGRAIGGMIGDMIGSMIGSVIGLARVCVRGCRFRPHLSQEGTYIIYNNIKPTKSPTPPNTAYYTPTILLLLLKTPFNPTFYALITPTNLPKLLLIPRKHLKNSLPPPQNPKKISKNFQKTIDMSKYKHII